MVFIPAVFFLLGAIIASFVGVIAGRLYTGQSFLSGRSRCDACTEPLSSLSLVPIVSYVLSRGRSLCCGAQLSWYAPLTELLLGALFVLAYQDLGLTPVLPFLLISLALLLALVIYDFAHQILPFPLLSTFVATSALVALVHAGTFADVTYTFIVAACIGGSLTLIHALSRGRAMGLADAPLAFGLSLLTGSAALTGFVFSFWIGAVIGIVLLLRRPPGSRMGVEVPFAPYLAAGFLLAHFTQWNLFSIIAALPPGAF